ncbi:MAG: lytic transglycosylase domain-containing protein, partial [Acidiferrobacterales bacterium]|nr:lytic transglycosylase domain-containing protein [Acidiferrobacterales bacterium]
MRLTHFSEFKTTLPFGIFGAISACGTRYLVWSFVLLSMVVLSSIPRSANADHLLPKHALRCSEDFPCPPELRRRVDFWIQVFKGWNKTKAILHDPNSPERVYMVIDTGKGCSRAVGKRIKANRKVIRDSLNSLATNLAKGRKISNKREQHLLTLFPNANVKRIRQAAKSIRCQSGVKDSFIAGLKRFNRYSAMVDRVLLENNLPADIRYLPFVESSYNPAAYSKAGAAGLWQIMPATARSLGLELNATVDERLDPEAATRAAAKYFLQATSRLTKVSREKDPNISMSNINPFVITSYNYGINGMRRAIRKVSPVYLEVLNKYKSPSFQVAVKNFYASFLAARHVALNADRYFKSVPPAKPLDSQTVVLQNATSIQRIEKVFGLGEKELKPLNRTLTRYIWNGWRLIPAGYRLRLPVDTP